MSVSVSRNGTRTVEPLHGTQAQMTAASQGLVWQGIGGTTAISGHVETADHIDARGDRLMAAHRQQLARAAAMARREGAYQTEAMLHELIASAAELAQLDDYEDHHRREISGHAAGTTGSLRQASALQSALLGHKEVELPVLDMPRCARARRHDRPRIGEGLTALPCDREAGHNGPCLHRVVAKDSEAHPCG